MIPFVRDIKFEYGRVDEVSPLIRRVVAENPGPFTYTGTGTYIIGRGEVAVIDPGPPLEAHLDALIKAVDGERVTHILTTHSHADHSPLAKPLAERTGAVVYGRPAPEAAALSPGLEEDDDGAFRPDVVVEDGQSVSGPGWTLRALATPGHISNHLCFILPEENALFTGDHIMGWSTTVVTPPHGDMGDYYQSLDRVIEGGFSTLWPTHGPPVTDTAPFLAAYKAHRLERERQILDQLARGPRRIPEMVAEIYASVDSRLHAAAGQSMLAHLIELKRRGVVDADAPPSARAEYRLTGGDRA